MSEHYRGKDFVDLAKKAGGAPTSILAVPGFIDWEDVLHECALWREGSISFSSAIRIVALEDGVKRAIIDELGVSRPTVGRWVDGARTPVAEMQKLVIDLIEKIAHNNGNKNA